MSKINDEIMLKHYIAIARPDHWFKNIFMLPGIILAIPYASGFDAQETTLKLVLAIISVCLIASSNYVINEWLDAPFDKFHPVKKNRPSVTKGLKAKYVYFEYGLLAIIGLGCASLISRPYFYISLLFLVMGFLYNVKPFRTKDRVYVDVLSESINNPIRLCLGWYIFTNTTMPPSSILLSYWMGGAFLMGAKRFAEYRFIDNKELVGQYRVSFQKYDEDKLLISTVFYAILSSFFLGAFLIKHKIELILCFPFFAILFAWYLHLSLQKDSPVQNPEKLYREKPLILFVIFLCVFTLVLLKVDIPFLKLLLE